jgi:hypothetical protein
MFMHDPAYITDKAWQNVAYNQRPHTFIYIGNDTDSRPRYLIWFASK